MGTDDLFHKRKARARSAKQLSRRSPKRAPYAKILIVCEGEKTEPNYFSEIQEYYEISTANVEIAGESGSSPKSIFQYARRRYLEAKDKGDRFDKVFCVFDKDTHETYNDACKAIKNATPKNTFYSITSVPSFEYWLLLHFIYTTKPYTELPGKSSGKQVINDLKSYMPDYNKSNKGIFLDLIDQLPQAKAYAKKTLEIAIKNNTDNPTTHIHCLVEFMENIKNQ
ncbi:RloB family protein [Vreelandella massiliensis]|uniref:RloB family protein n=1 Tax=Vreelandella massiliensis TaxID=1816686 RepID=UPI00096A4971|nr:RloB family protein [Halomonas massiliensis]